MFPYAKVKKYIKIAKKKKKGQFILIISNNLRKSNVWFFSAFTRDY